MLTDCESIDLWASNALIVAFAAANKSWRTRTVKKKRAQLAAFSASGRVKAQKGSAKSPKLSKKKLQEQKQAQLEKDKVQKAKVASDVDKVRSNCFSGFCPSITM